MRNTEKLYIGEKLKSRVWLADHIWKEKGTHQPLWDEAKIIFMEEHGKIKRLKEAAYMLGYNDLLSRPSIDMNTIWEQLITKAS